jgi:hypothetical protein
MSTVGSRAVIASSSAVEFRIRHVFAGDESPYGRSELGVELPNLKGRTLGRTTAWEHGGGRYRPDDASFNFRQSP